MVEAGEGCYCHLRNVYDKFADGNTSHTKRFHFPIHGPFMSFGAKSLCKPISVICGAKLDQRGHKMLSGVSFGYVLNAAGRGGEGERRSVRRHVHCRFQRVGDCESTSEVNFERFDNNENSGTVKR